MSLIDLLGDPRCCISMVVVGGLGSFFEVLNGLGNLGVCFDLSVESRCLLGD